MIVSMNESFSTLQSSPSVRRASHEEISQRAQQLWESMGRPLGRDEEIWLQAERELTTASAPAETSRTTTSTVTALEVVSARTKPAAAPRKTTSRTSRAAAR